MIVTGCRAAYFVANKLSYGLVPPYTAMGIEQDGKVTAACVFNNFEGADVAVTAAGKGWTRGYLESVGEYVFNQLGCERMTFTTEQPNVARLGVRLGGKIEGTLRNHFGPNRDGIIVGVLRNEWKFYRVAHETASLT